MGPLTLHATIVLKIGQMGHCEKKWNPTRHVTVMGAQLYVKIKSHQLRPNGKQKYNTGPQPGLTLVHINHWADKICELLLSVHSSPPFPITCAHSRITSPLYYYPMNMFYGLYPVDTDVSDFVATAYQAEQILRLATKPEMGWYARNMPELQLPNRTIGIAGPTRRVITHQATSWTK